MNKEIKTIGTHTYIGSSKKDSKQKEDIEVNILGFNDINITSSSSDEYYVVLNFNNANSVVSTDKPLDSYKFNRVSAFYNSYVDGPSHIKEISIKLEDTDDYYNRNFISILLSVQTGISQEVMDFLWEELNQRVIDIFGANIDDILKYGKEKSKQRRAQAEEDELKIDGDYPQDILEKAQTIFDNCLFVGKDLSVDTDGVSILLQDKSSGMEFWFDLFLSNKGDLQGDWNQNIFFTDNTDDLLRQALQNNGRFFEHAFEVAEDYALEKNIISLNNKTNKYEIKTEARFKDKVKVIKHNLKKNDKRLSDETAQKSAENIAGSIIKNESIDNGWKPEEDFIIEVKEKIEKSLGLPDFDAFIDAREPNMIEFRYLDGKMYYAEPVSMSQVDVFDENHKQIGWGVVIDKIKEEVFTDYITDSKFIYELVGGDKAGNYTKEQLDNLDIINGNTGENPGRRDELKNQPKLKGYLGPMWNGTKDGMAVIRYETQEVYDQLSETKRLNEIASRVPGTEVEKKSVVINKETIGNLLDEIDDALSIDEIYEIAKRFKNDLDKETILQEIEAIELEYDLDEIDEDSDEYNDILDELKSCISSDFGGQYYDLNENKKLEEDEIIDRPEDIIDEQEEEDTEDESTFEDESIIGLLEDRIGQELEAGRLNSILQSIFSMYTRTFIMPDDLYNMDLYSTQTLNIDVDGDEYTIYYDIIDVDDGIIKITDVEVL